MSRHRLPRSVLPRTYRVVLEPDLVATTFRGSVDVAVEVIEPTTEVILHAAELTLECVIVSDATGEQPCTWHLDEAEQQLVLRFDAPLSEGMATLSFVYDGVLNDRLEGFYRSTYDGPDGKPVTIATTQFQATDARLAMPCFDEPDMKAVFEVSLVVAAGLTAVANTAEVERHTLDDGRTRIRFAPTIPMSTYLVAFVVGDLEMTEPRMVRNTPVRVVHRPGQAHLTGFALDVAEHSLALFEDYYGIPYRGDKLDLVALPDFAAGAMENLGCITFREVLLLVDPASATQPELQDVVDVVGHEIAHLWFGDLVTMKWWNGIWLNEAFATFMELKATDAFRPDWQRWDTFAISRFSAAEVDSLASTRAVEFEVVTPADASAMFDVLTYLKGASVVRMLEQYLGEDVFRDGIRHYLRTHEYGNTETHDLWDSLEAVSGEPVRAMMETWIFQGGYPMIDVSVDGRTATLSQRRFRLDTSSQDHTRWMVPIRLRVAEAELRTRLDGPTMTLELPEGALVTANAGGTGFYRVALDEPPDSAQLGALATIERAIIVDDTWALVLAGHLPVTRFFALADLLRSETDVTVWQRLLGCLGQLSFSVADEHTAAYATRVRGLVVPALIQRGWEPTAGESDRQRSLRGLLIQAAGGLGQDQAVREHARGLLDTSGLDPEVRAAVIGVVAAGGDVATFESLWRRSVDATDPQDSQRFLHALADVPDPHAARWLCDLSLSEIRSQDAPYVLRRALVNRRTNTITWSFIEDRWDDINATFPASSIERLLTGIRTLSHPDLAPRIARFLTDHRPPQAARAIDQHLELLAAHSKLRDRAAELLARELS